MQYFEQTLEFSDRMDVRDSNLTKSFSEDSLNTISHLYGDAENAGIVVRLGQEPIVRNLQELIIAANGTIPSEIAVLFKKSDIYTVVHAIGAIRLSGRAKVEELHYHAFSSTKNAQTIDLMPHTRFKEVLKANVTFNGSMLANGSFGTEIPAVLSNSLTSKYFSLGGDMKVELSTNASFLGKFTYSLKLPVVQSIGIASDTCSWVLNPDENQTPLLGDQLLVQTIAVPKGTDHIDYEIQGVLKVDRGIFWKRQTKETNKYKIQVPLPK